MTVINHFKSPWIAVYVYVAFIYSTLGIMPGVAEGLEMLTEGASSRMINAASVFIVGATFVLMVNRTRSTTGVGMSFLIALGCVAVLVLAKTPWERIHLTEYGVLAYLVFRGFKHDQPGEDGTIYVCSAVFCGITGFLDEIIQMVIPVRIFDTRDILMNVVSGLLALAIIWVLSVKGDTKEREV